MKLFNWVHNKLNGRQSTISDTNISASTKNQAQHIRDEKEEFSDWPQGILSIGTLFTKASKEDTKDQHNNGIFDLTMEEVKELQTLVSSNNDINGFSDSDGDDRDQGNNVDHLSSYYNNGEEEICDQDIRAIVTNNNCSKEVYMDNNNGSKAVMGQKTLSFLLKKMFICGYSGSLAPTPSLRDPIHSAATRKIKVSKILRAMLRKKIYPQNSCSSNMTTCKKYLGMSGRIGSSNYEDDEDGFDNGGDRSTKWVKTDTDYIVLEI